MSSVSGPEPRFNINTSSWQHKKCHWGDNKVVRSSFLLTGIFYTSKMKSLHWIIPRILSTYWNMAVRGRHIGVKASHLTDHLSDCSKNISMQTTAIKALHNWPLVPGIYRQHQRGFLKQRGNGPLTTYVKLRFAHAPGTFSRYRLQRKPLISNPGMHHGTCVTHVPWRMSGSLTHNGRENVRGIPGTCANRNFIYLVRGP